MEKSERENNTSSESGQEMQVKPEFCDLKPEAGLTLAHLSFIYYFMESISLLFHAEIIFNISKITPFTYLTFKTSKCANVSLGPCTGSFFRYFYNSSIDDCASFHYGGCDGNENNFHTLFACRALCQEPNSTEDDLIFKVIPLLTLRYFSRQIVPGGYKLLYMTSQESKQVV